MPHGTSISKCAQGFSQEVNWSGELRNKMKHRPSYLQHFTHQNTELEVIPCHLRRIKTIQASIMMIPLLAVWTIRTHHKHAGSRIFLLEELLAKSGPWPCSQKNSDEQNHQTLNLDDQIFHPQPVAHFFMQLRFFPKGRPLVWYVTYRKNPRNLPTNYTKLRC